MEDFLELTEKSGYLKEDFRLFHIRDQSDRKFSYHYHDFHKVVFFISGNAAYHIEGKVYHLRPWDILLVNQHATHCPEIHPDVPYERFILWIRGDIQNQELNRCFQKASDRSFNLIRLNDRIQNRLKDLLSELEAALNSQEFGSALLGEALFTQLMVYLNRIFLEKQYIVDRMSYTCDDQVEHLLRYINQNLNADLSADALAAKYFLSKYHLMRKFKEKTGYTLHNYITSKRLLYARDLISHGLPVLKASSMCGFSDYTTFSRAYKKHFGAPPSGGRRIKEKHG